MTGSELVAKLRHIAPRHIEGRARDFAFRMEGLCLQELNELINQAADFIEQTLTPPEGDTLSDKGTRAGLVAARSSMVLAMKRLQAYGDTEEGVSGAYCDLKIAVDHATAALQSRVSPQEGLREALEETYAAMRWIYEHGMIPAPMRPQWVSDVFNEAFASRRIARAQDAALSASRMSEDAKP